MFEPVSTGIAITLLVKSASSWLPAISDALIPPVRDAILSKVTERTFDRLGEQRRKLFHLDEKEQKRHLELALKNAAERGLAQFQTTEEQQQYNQVISVLSTSHADALRREALRLFTLNDEPDFKKLATLFDQARSQTQSVQGQAIDATPFFSSFFRSLIAELYADPSFRQQISDVLRVRAEMSMQRSLTEVLSTLNRIGETLVDNYTPEQFEKDVRAYTEHIERTLRYLKLVGVVPKERTNENRDPELDGIFVPLKIAGNHSSLSGFEETIIDFLEHNSYLVLLGGPGSGKSTSICHLAWSHAATNLPNSNLPNNIPLLSGKPLPQLIELRRLNEDRRRGSNHNFLTYATEVLLRREGLNISIEMFKQLLERRAMLILFDGLDEVATLNDRRILINEIESIAQLYPGNRYVITSRPVGYYIAHLSTQLFLHAQIKPFDSLQILLFLHQWYAYVLRLFPLSSNDQQELAVLYKTMISNSRLRSLAENPFLLSVITALHRYERLPDRRFLVYEKCADLLLEVWASVKGTDARWQGLRLSKDDQHACIAHLGFVLHQRSQEQPEDNINEEVDDQDELDEDEEIEPSSKELAIDVPSRFILREIGHFLQSQHLYSSIAEQNLQAELFLKLVQEEAGLIVERGNDENGEPLYGFIHRTFQEYFAAVDVYERYRSDEDTNIISEFLRDHLHDPHWREVILLLFGKLGRRPTTKQLNYILDGTIKSQRSEYTDIMQQDLFLVSSCLAEEIIVEISLSEKVISCLGTLIRKSPHALQRKEAIKHLANLVQSRQYSTEALKELLSLTLVDPVPDIDIRMWTTLHLYVHSSPEIKEQIVQAATAFVQSTIHSSEFALNVVNAVWQYDLDHSKTEKFIAEAEKFIVELFWAIGHRSDLSFTEQILIICRIQDNQFSPLKAKRFAKKKLPILLQNLDLSFEQRVLIARDLYEYSSEGSKLERNAIRMISDLAKDSNFPINEGTEIANSIYQWNEEDNKYRRFATNMLVSLVQRPTITFEQKLEIARVLYEHSISQNADRIAVRILKDLGQHPDLTFEQNIQIVDILTGEFPSDDASARLARQILMHLAKQADLSIEQEINIAEMLYANSPSHTKTQQIALEMLDNLSKCHNLSIEQSLLVARALYWCDDDGSKRREAASRMLLSLVQCPDLPIERFIEVIESLRFSDSIEEAQQLITRLLMSLFQRSYLPIEESIQVASNLSSSADSKSEARQLAIRLLFKIAQDQNLTSQQRLEAATAIFKNSSISFQERWCATEIALTLPQEETGVIKQSFEKHWESILWNFLPEIRALDIPWLFRFAEEDRLPTKTRDEAYRRLSSMIPQFNFLENAD